LELAAQQDYTEPLAAWRAEALANNQLNLIWLHFSESGLPPYFHLPDGDDVNL